MPQAPALRETIVAIFERHRATPAAPFDETHFLDFLLAAPKRIGDVRNSFLGLRRFNAFIDEVQLELSVFLSIKDREANYSLAQFVERMSALMASRRSSLASLRNYSRHGFGWHAVAIFNILAIGVAVAAFRYSQSLGLLLSLLALLANGALARLYLYERAYIRRITAQLSAEAAP